MNVAVLGGGVIGVTTAWYLVKAGHSVTVIDRRHDVGLETTFANGGLIVPSMSSPWAAPGTLGKMMKWLGRSDAPMIFKLRTDPAFWRWTFRFLRNCSVERNRDGTLRSLRVALYSAACLDDLRRTTGIEYDQETRGVLYVFRVRAELEAFVAGAADLEHHDIAFNVLDRDGCVQLEPALGAVAHTLVGGVHFPTDQSGDALTFTRKLKSLCAEAGVRFRTSTEIMDLVIESGCATGVATSNGVLAANAVVLALGSYSPVVARRAGLQLPVYPVKGYSITLSMDDWSPRPSMPVVDNTLKIAATPLGARMRVAGIADVVGYDLRYDRARAAGITRALHSLYPWAGAVPEAFWCGLRPATPDGPPLLGRTPIRNLFLNTGHGPLGWTMACGSSRVLADIVSGVTPEIDLDGLTLDRFH